MIAGRFKIRTLIPGLLIAAELLLAGYAFLVQRPNLHMEAKELATKAEIARMRRLQGALSTYLQGDNQTGVDQELFYISSDVSVERALLLDENNRVMFGSRTIWRGRPVSQVMPEADPRAIRNARDTAVVETRDADRPFTLISYAGLVYADKSGTHRATLVVRNNYQVTDYRLVNAAMKGTYWLLGILGAFILVSWALLTRAVTNRIRHLVKVTTDLSDGDYDARAAMQGQDEIAQLGRAFDEMADHVAEARRSLEDARLSAEKASLSKSNFLANMSHEIRTPLTGVIGMLDLIERKQLDTDTRFLVKTAQGSAEHLLGLINDILDVSKLEAGRMEVEPTPVVPADIIESVATLLRPRAEEKDLSLITQVSFPGLCILSDGRFLRQILLNLVANAIRFTDHGQVRITCDVRSVSASRWRLTLTVADTGTGIAPDDLGRLFDRFEQADASLSRKHQGTGLGLAITRDLVRLLDGEVNVTSSLGEGSTFTVTFEADSADLPRTIVAPRKEDRPQALNLLAVDDNPVNRLLIARILESMGHTVAVAAGGAEAVAAVRESLLGRAAAYDAVLMDIQMPEMDGLEALARIRALGPETAALPVIAVTANAVKGQAEEYLAAGMNGYVSKPIDREKLTDELTRLTGAAATAPKGAMIDCADEKAAAALDAFTESL